MPNISCNSPFLRDGANPDMQPNTLQVTGKDLPENTPVSISLNYNGALQLFTTNTDENGNLNYTANVDNADVQPLLSLISFNQAWSDVNTSWTQEIDDSKSVVIWL